MEEKQEKKNEEVVTDNSKGTEQDFSDPFKCPDDDFLRSIWPSENKGLAKMKQKRPVEEGPISKREPLVKFGIDVNYFRCPGCQTNLTKSSDFWPTTSFIGNVHVDKKPRLILCRKCVAKYYEKLLEHFNNDIKKSMFQLCFDFDFYFDPYLIEKLMYFKYHDGSTHPDNKFPDTYLKIITSVNVNNPYKGKNLFQQITYDVFQQIIDGQYNFEEKKKQIEEQKQKDLELTLSKEDKMHRSKILAVYLYDPFEKYPVEERPGLYRSLFMMLDENIETDLPRQRAALEIVTKYMNLEKLNNKLQQIIQDDDCSKEAADNISKWSDASSKMASIIEKQAKENGFSMRYAGSAGKGSGTLSGVQKELLEGYDDDIVTNYYDIKTSSSIKHIAEISSKAMVEQLELNENDYVNMIKEQRDYIAKLTTENDKMGEELRLIKAKMVKGRLLEELKQEFIAKGIDQEEIASILEDEYTVPPTEDGE